MNIFGRLIPAWIWFASIGALFALLGVQQVRVDRAKTATAEARTALANDRVTYAQAAQVAESVARAEEARRALTTRKTIEDAYAQVKAAQDDALRAGDSAQRLQQRVTALVAAARAGGTNPAIAGRGPSQQGSDALDLLVGMQSRIDGAAGQLGDYADRLRVAGLACERISDGLQPSGR